MDEIRFYVFIDAVEFNDNCNVHMILISLWYPNHTNKLFLRKTVSKWVLVIILEINVYFVT